MCTLNFLKSLQRRSVHIFQATEKILRVTLYSFILCSSTPNLPSGQPSTISMPPAGGTINHFNFNASPIMQNSADQQANQDAIQKSAIAATQQSIQETKTDVTQTTKIDQTITLKTDFGVAKFIQDCADQCNAYKNQGGSLLQNIRYTIVEHKWKLIALTLATSYGVIAYKIYQIEQRIQQYNSWCNWKSAIPLQHLMLTPTTDLVTQLNFDMYCKYGLIIKNMSDTCTIPDIFLHDLQEEINLLERYTSLLNIISTLHCKRLFFFKYNIDLIEEKKARLTFVYNLFMMIQTQQKK